MTCSGCQHSLFNSIREGQLVFDDNISTGAKNLIKCLLVKDSSTRLGVDGVMSHPWLLNSDDNQLTERNFSPPIDIPRSSNSGSIGSYAPVGSSHISTPWT